MTRPEESPAPGATVSPVASVGAPLDLGTLALSALYGLALVAAFVWTVTP